MEFKAFKKLFRQNSFKENIQQYLEMLEVEVENISLKIKIIYSNSKLIKNAEIQFFFLIHQQKS